MANTIISSDQHWILWAILLSVSAFSIWAEKTKIGKKLSAVVIAILGTFVLSNLSIIPSSAPSYDIVWSYLVPLAIPLLLFRANLKRIIKETGPTLIAFILGGIGTVVGTIIAFLIVPLGENGWKLASIFSATYIGGSMNYVAAAEAVKLDSANLIAAGVAADNLVMAAYFLILFAIPSIKFLQNIFPNHHQKNAEKLDNNNFELDSPSNLDGLNIATSIAISAIICAVGFGLSDLINIDGSGILIITFINVVIATVFPNFMQKLSGAEILGTY